MPEIFDVNHAHFRHSKILMRDTTVLPVKKYKIGIGIENPILVNHIWDIKQQTSQQDVNHLDNRVASPD